MQPLHDGEHCKQPMPETKTYRSIRQEPLQVDIEEVEHNWEFEEQNPGHPLQALLSIMAGLHVVGLKVEKQFKVIPSQQ